jgi:hypothetical protein
MIRATKSLLAMSLLAGLGVGCTNDTPHDYGQQRSDINQLDPRDSGLQSKDVQAATSQMVQSLLALPDLNNSTRQWTLVVGNFDDQTRDRTFSTNYDIFLESLRAAISEKGQGRIQLIENRDKFHSLRDKELEGTPDQFQQGGANSAAPAAINPDFELYGKAYDMPNRATNFFMLEYDITNLHLRTQVWTRIYQVKAMR